MIDHSKHNSSLLPVLGCPDCDREIGRPIKRCFGKGSSTSVIPTQKVEVTEPTIIIVDVIKKSRKKKASI